jgi:hypothetical protein
MLGLKERVRCRACGARGRAVVSIRWGLSERLTLASRHNQHAPRAGLGGLGYGNTAAAKEVAPQIAAHNPRDESEIRIKDARVSARSSEAGVSNGSGGGRQSGREKPPRNRILLSTTSLHSLVCIKLWCASNSLTRYPCAWRHLCQKEVLGRLLRNLASGPVPITGGGEYLKHGRKNEAAVIAGIVFEDTIRRVCRVFGVAEKGVALDTLISELAKQDPPVLTTLKSKRARADAGLRTSAAHARWEGDRD